MQRKVRSCSKVTLDIRQSLCDVSNRDTRRKIMLIQLICPSEISWFMKTLN